MAKNSTNPNKNLKKAEKIIEQSAAKEGADNQAVIQSQKKEKVKKLVIKTKEVEKISLLSIGNNNSSSVEKTSINFKKDETSQPEKFSLNIGGEVKKGKKNNGQALTKTETVQMIIKGNQDSKIVTSYSDRHFSIGFIGGRLLTPNVIFSALQYHKYDVFAYKKAWHVIISRELERLHSATLKGADPLPFFKDSVVVTVYRQSPTLVDEDALTVMFKYILDALKRDKNNKHGVLYDDNPKIIFKSETFNEAGEHEVGLRLDYRPELHKERYSMDKLLNGTGYNGE